MSRTRRGISNKLWHRRVAAVQGHSHTSIIECFCEAAWAAGPVGVLRCRTAQKGLLRIFDTPRAGAILKHHLTQPNTTYWRLPNGVCGLCLDHYEDDLQEWERCFWCHDTTLCRGCTLPVPISLRDPRVREAPCYAYERLERYKKVEDDSGRVILPGCVMCVRDSALLPDAAIYGHWHCGFWKVLDDLAGDLARSISEYFYREVPRHTNAKYRRIFPCTSLEVCGYKRIIKEWLSETRRVRSAARLWSALSIRVQKASLRKAM